jgi:hypothetical protein
MTRSEREAFLCAVHVGVISVEMSVEYRVLCSFALSQ